MTRGRTRAIGKHTCGAVRSLEALKIKKSHCKLRFSVGNSGSKVSKKKLVYPTNKKFPSAFRVFVPPTPRLEGVKG